jgi:hypothetical protein
MIIVINEIYFHRLFFSPTYTRSIEYLSLYIFQRIHHLVLSKYNVCKFDICNYGNIEKYIFLDKL